MDGPSGSGKRRRGFVSHPWRRLVAVTSRLDISQIQPLGAYAAKRCPVRVQLDVLRPCEPAEPPPFQRFQFDAGDAFESAIVDSLTTDADGNWVVVAAAADRSERERMTLEAMEAETPVIIGGRLPPDATGRRVGEPDLLVWHDAGYVPIDIKHHSTLNEDDEGLVRCSPLHEPFPAAAVGHSGSRRNHRGDALQLAHYVAMLRAAEAASAAPVGGIVGREGVVVWYDLTEPLWITPAKSDGRRRKLRSTFEVYDFEFGFRCDIAATAVAHLEDRAVALLVEPMRSAECSGCPWRVHCDPIVEAPPGDTSLLPKVRYAGWRALRDIGIRDRRQVTSLDLTTALLIAEDIPVAEWLAAAESAPPQTEIAELRSRSPKQIAALETLGFATAADIVARLDPVTARLSGRWVPEAIIAAHAISGSAPVYRRPGVTAVEVPRCDIEIDIDMENTFDGVYMWGALVTDRVRSGAVASGYRSFHTWQAMTAATERAVFDEFWSWLQASLATCRRRGLTVRCFVWHEPAENAQLRRVTRGDAELRDAVEALIQSELWVDLRRVFLTQLTTGEGTGLKAIAPLAGFAWDVEDPGGAMSMVYHGIATADESDEALRYRKWLVEYNRGDVMATAQVRNWMTTTEFPALDALS